MKGVFKIISALRKWWINKWQNQPPRKTAPISVQNTPDQTKNPLPLKRFYCYLLLGIASFLVVVISGLFSRTQPVREVANVVYMDSVHSNFLFRGGLPQVGNPPDLNYNGLKKAIRNAGKRAGVKVPSDFYLIDVNFLNIENPGDAERIQVEQRFFQSNPNLGRIQVWGMNGTGLHLNNPALAECRTYLARNLDNWLSDQLATRVEILRGWLEGPSMEQHGRIILPIVIYIHCVAGCDRTGEFSGAYYLRYLNKSWEEVNEINRGLCFQNRPFGCRNYRAVQWYCLWLNLQRGFSLHWWQDFSCSGN